MTAGGKKAEQGFWEATRDSLLETCQQYKNSELFHELAGLFCNGFAAQVEATISVDVRG